MNKKIAYWQVRQTNTKDVSWHMCTKEDYDIFKLSSEHETRVIFVPDRRHVPEQSPLAYYSAEMPEILEQRGYASISATRAGDCQYPLYAAPVIPENIPAPLDAQDLELYVDMLENSDSDDEDGELNNTQLIVWLKELQRRRALSAQPVIPEQTERERIRREHAEWSDATFGNVGPVGPLKHLSKEALEAAADPDDPLEWADMQFLLWDAQRRMGLSDGFITRAMIEKLEINKKRQWPEPRDGEPRLHINTQSPQPVSEHKAEGDFLSRLKAEHVELEDRCIKLSNFIQVNPAFKNLAPRMQRLLESQIVVMTEYVQILECRIEIIEAPAQESE